MRHRSRALSVVMVLGTAISTIFLGGGWNRVNAADHFLTIGGGAAATHNQTSLEKNVRYLQRMLASSGVAGEAQAVFFSDGTDPGHDLQYRDPASPTPRVNALLTRLFDANHEDDLDVRYRSADIPNISGPSSRQELNKWFDTIGSKLAKADRLVIYFTGHGGGGNPPRNTTITVWNDRDMAVQEFVGLLDKLSPQVQVVLVMVQCHSGGFADVIFQDAAKRVLSPSCRCGFFATLHDRQAAGCTSDIDDENYREYSTYFWSALFGTTRTGHAVAMSACDFDGDGRVSFAEAHAYVQLVSDTIDIPVSTSDTFLRVMSNTSVAGGMTVDTTYDKLVPSATPAEKAVLEGLSDQLGLWGRERTKACRVHADRWMREKSDLDARRNKTIGEANNLRQQIRNRLVHRWPEFITPWHPAVQSILHDEADNVIHAIENDASYPRLDQLLHETDGLATQSRDLERKWVKCQRYLRVSEDVALAANLEHVASPEIQQRYKELLVLENGTLPSPRREPVEASGSAAKSNLPK